MRAALRSIRMNCERQLLLPDVFSFPVRARQQDQDFTMQPTATSGLSMQFTGRCLIRVVIERFNCRSRWRLLEWVIDVQG